MANTIRIKRSTGSGAPSSLANAELAYAEASGVLYYGTGTGGSGGSATSIVQVGGQNPTFATVTTTGNAVIGGDLTVNGTTTTVNSTTVAVDDKNLELGSVATPTDTTADGGGITLKGATDKTLNWVDSSDSWTSSEHLDLASGKVYKINGTEVLSGSSIGSGVTGSSLTSLGTIATGVWAATDVAVAHGGTGASTAAGALTNLGLTATAAEINSVCDGATLAAAELNIIDGATSATATTLASADRMVINDGGTMVQVALSDLVTYLENGTASGFELDGGSY